MAVDARKLWLRRLLLSFAAGCGGAFALWVIDEALVRYGIPPEKTLLDNILVGILVALLVFALDTYHQAELRRLRQAAELMGQLNHYIRNSLQVILYSSSMPGPASQEAICTAVRRIEWVLESLVHESALFSGASTYLSGEGRNELDMKNLLQTPPEPPPKRPEQSRKNQAG